MLAFYYDTDTKLVEIFTEHCNLSGEQYNWIRGEMIYLVADIQEEEEPAEIEERTNKMGIVFDFLMETGELTLKEHHELAKKVQEILDKAEVFRKAAEARAI
jgi:hypothetical protein